MDIQSRTDPVTRYVFLSYRVPASAPEEVRVNCQVRREPNVDWEPAVVWAHISPTANALVPPDDWHSGVHNGRLVERRAAGSTRTLIWNPFPGYTDQCVARVRITFSHDSGQLETGEILVELDNSDVVLLDDWSQVLQSQFVSTDPAPGEAVWWWRTGQTGDDAPAGGRSLEVRKKNIELPQLTYPLNLRGPHALFVSLPPKLCGIELRLSGDERIEDFGFASHLDLEPTDPAIRPGEEAFWKWADMDWQNLIIRQPYRTVYEYEEEFRAALDTIRLVPLSPEDVRRLEEEWRADDSRRLVIGYQEPYGWSFTQKIESNLQHREPLLAFAEARVDMLDIQFLRGGSSSVSETRVGTQLVTETHGDPVRGEVPHTANVGRMVQYTNTFESQFKYAHQLGIEPRANMGATNCYAGTNFESEFSREHPDWNEGSALLYEIPEVRAYILSLFEEMLEMGARHISTDWCRYPHALKDNRTVTIFLRQLRQLADRFSTVEEGPVAVLVRFPARGAPMSECMDYETWIEEGLADFLVPSNIFNSPLCFEIDEYLEAAKGTKTKILPNVEPCVPLPGLWFQRLLNCYEAGAEGVFIYQCDAPVSRSHTRRYISLAGSLEALRRWQERELQEQSRYSKGIYLSAPHRKGTYQPYERLRVWVEGVDGKAVELWVDDSRINSYEKPPYILGSEALEDDHLIPAGAHSLRVRARDGEGWLEQEFPISVA